jgi:hypothetical protein
LIIVGHAPLVADIASWWLVTVAVATLVIVKARR